MMPAWNRLVLFVFLLHLSVVLAVAQQPDTAEIDHRTGKRAFTLEPDVLLYPITLGMTPSTVESVAERQGWEVEHRYESSLHLRKQRPQGTVGLMTIGFHQGRAYSATGTIVVPREKRDISSPDSSRYVISLRNRAYDVATEGNRTIYLSRTSDGRTLRTVWTQVSETEAKIEVTLE